MKLQKIIITVAALMAGAAMARAEVQATTDDSGQTEHIWRDPHGWAQNTFNYDREPRSLFNANELTFDLFGTYLNPERNFTAFPNTNIRRGTWGGGVGANYFWSRDVGFGADTSFQTSSARFVDHVGGNLIVRLPIEPIRLAPYVFAGGGRKFDPIGAWFGDAGAGLEFRLNRNLGIFGDARFIWNDRIIRANGTRNEALIRSGLRLAF